MLLLLLWHCSHVFPFLQTHVLLLLLHLLLTRRRYGVQVRAPRSYRALRSLLRMCRAGKDVLLLHT